MDTCWPAHSQSARGDMRHKAQVRMHNAMPHCELEKTWTRPRYAARSQESRCAANATRSSTPSSTADTTNVRCNTTYHRILSLGVPSTFMKIRSRWIEEIATMEAATLSF